MLLIRSEPPQRNFYRHRLQAPMPLALITGAASPLGRAIAKSLEGYDLLLHTHRTDLKTLTTELRRENRQIWTVAADFSAEEGVEEVAAAARALNRPIDALIHNAGRFEAEPVAQISRHRFRETMAINLETPLFLTQALLPQLRAAKAPAIVHLADIEGSLAGYTSYVVSKAALTMLTKQLATELGPHIRVNAVAPGIIGEAKGFSEEAQAALRARIPAGRFGKAEELAEVVRFLVEGPAFVHGQVWAVDGGRSTRR